MGELMGELVALGLRWTLLSFVSAFALFSLIRFYSLAFRRSPWGAKLSSQQQAGGEHEAAGVLLREGLAESSSYCTLLIRVVGILENEAKATPRRFHSHACSAAQLCLTLTP